MIHNIFSSDDFHYSTDMIQFQSRAIADKDSEFPYISKSLRTLATIVLGGYASLDSAFSSAPFIDGLSFLQCYLYSNSYSIMFISLQSKVSFPHILISFVQFETFRNPSLDSRNCSSTSVCFSFPHHQLHLFLISFLSLGHDILFFFFRCPVKRIPSTQTTVRKGSSGVLPWSPPQDTLSQ